MKPFWITNFLMLAGVALLVAIEVSRIPRWSSGELEWSQGEWAASRYVIAAAMLSVVWSICFRKQIENRRLSLFAIFALVTIQAAGLWLVRVTSP
jgi:hypothetical protein